MLRVIEPSEHDGVIYMTLGATQVYCVGENEPVKKPPSRLKNLKPTHFRENRYLKMCVGGVRKILWAKKLS